MTVSLWLAYRANPCGGEGRGPKPRMHGMSVTSTVKPDWCPTFLLWFISHAFTLPQNKGACQHPNRPYSLITNLSVQVHLHLQSITLPSQYRIGGGGALAILDSSCLKSRKSEVLASWRAAFGVTFWIQLCWAGWKGWSTQTTLSVTMMTTAAWWLR